MRQKGGMVGREHDRVALRAFGAKRGQRAARGPDCVELVNLNCPFGPACFLHDVFPDGLLPSLPADPIIGAISPTAPTLFRGAVKSLFGFLKLC